MNNKKQNLPLPNPSRTLPHSSKQNILSNPQHSPNPNLNPTKLTK